MTELVSSLEQSLLTCFSRVVAAYGSRSALASDLWQPSYRELDETANRLAHVLLRQGGGTTGDRVALLMRNDVFLICAMLSVLKAGRIAVVLHPTDPPDRLRGLLEDAKPQSILSERTYRELAGQVASNDSGIICYEDYATQDISDDPSSATGRDAIAFLVYTSGSTGRPKAVMQTHGQILQNAVKHSTAMGLGPEDRVALFASMSGSQGVGTIWSALSKGALLLPFPVVEKGVTGLADWIVNRGITVYISSASLFRNFMKTLDGARSFPQVRVVRIASETTTSDDFKSFQRHFSDNCAFVHTLSCSETGNIAQWRLFRRDSVPNGRLPVGRAAEGMEILLLDERDREVEHGEIGEIVVRGRDLSAGYWRNEALTLERFTGPCNEVRTFRSGDLGRINSDGLLEFIGRRDTRVKIRGFRVEATEVEEALLELPGVESAAVCAVERSSGDCQLVAYVVLRRGHSSTDHALRRALRPILPDHMIPAAFIFLNSFPLTPHGKIDRDRLRAIDLPRRDPTREDRPRSETELLLATIWAEVFNLTQVGRLDDFFDLGGDSLKAAMVAAAIHDATGVELNLAVMAKHSNLAELARVVEKLRLQQTPERISPRREVLPNRHVPLSLFQERLWKFCEVPQAAAGDVFVRSHRVLGPLDIEVFSQSITYMAARHELLRTTFSVLDDGCPCQVVHPPAPVPLRLLDLSGMRDAEQQALMLFKRDSAQKFDLTTGPLVRFLLVRIHETEHLLLRMSHNIISDGSSWNIYFAELARVYEAKLRGDEPVLPKPALPYTAYAVMQRKLLHPNGTAYKEAVAWWKRVLSEGPRPVELPFKRAERLAKAEPADGLIRCTLDAQVTLQLEDLGRRGTATCFMVRLAVFTALLADEVGEPDIVIGTYIANRSRQGTQGMFGLVTNLAMLHIHCMPSKSFLDWLPTVKRTVFEVQARGEIPYEELCRELRAQGVTPPEIRVLFHTTADRAIQQFDGLKLISMELETVRMPWGFSMILDERSQDRNCTVAFDAAIYDPAGVRAFIERFNLLLEAVARQPKSPIGELLAMTRPIRDQFAGFTNIAG